MQGNAALVEGDIALHREGVARGTERGNVLAYTDVAREEARVVAGASLEDAAHAGGGGRVRRQGYPRYGGIARPEERVQVGAGERRQLRGAVCGGIRRRGRARLSRGGIGSNLPGSRCRCCWI